MSERKIKLINNVLFYNDPQKAMLTIPNMQEVLFYYKYDNGSKLVFRDDTRIQLGVCTEDLNLLLYPDLFIEEARKDYRNSAEYYSKNIGEWEKEMLPEKYTTWAIGRSLPEWLKWKNDILLKRFRWVKCLLTNTDQWSTESLQVAALNSIRCLQIFMDGEIKIVNPEG